MLELGGRLSSSRRKCFIVIEVEASMDDGRLAISRLEMLNEPLEEESPLRMLSRNFQSPDRTVPCKAHGKSGSCGYGIYDAAVLQFSLQPAT